MFSDGKMDDLLSMRISLLVSSKVPGREINKVVLTRSFGSGSRDGDISEVISSINEESERLRGLLKKEGPFSNLSEEDQLSLTRMYEGEYLVKISVVDYNHLRMTFRIPLTEKYAWMFQIKALWNMTKFKN